MSSITIGFALVGLAGFAVGVLSLIFAVNANSLSRRLQMTWEMSKPAKLAAEVADLAAALEAAKKSHRSELGRVWQKFDGFELARPPPHALDFTREDWEMRGVKLEQTACENWTAAQLEGPRSKAATCECAYCLRQRAARAAEKAAILAERNRAKANGSE
jgi:hypothetical protein